MSKKLERLNKKQNKIFCNNMLNRFEELYPDIKSQGMAEKLHLSLGTFNGYRRDGFPVDMIDEVAEELECKAKDLLIYKADNDLKAINSAFTSIILSTPSRLITFIVMAFVVMLAVNVNSKCAEPVGTFNSGLIMGFAIYLLGSITLVEDKLIVRRLSKGLGLVTITLSTLGFCQIFFMTP